MLIYLYLYIYIYIYILYKKNGINVDFFYTFGSPRVGDDQFRFYVKNLYSGFKARVVNKHDPVPHLPMDI